MRPEAALPPTATAALSPPVVWRPETGPRAGPVRVWSAGLIANRDRLRAECGLPKDAADRELLAELYRRHGAGAAQRIAGTLSWILLDPARNRLLAARDRAGVFGLYWGETADRLVVGDRLGPVRAELPAGELNHRALVARVMGCAPPPGETGWVGIHALEPGAVLVGEAEGRRVQRYWRLERQPTLRLASDGEYAAALRELLFTVAGEQRPREPCAVALSGGLDSTAVAAALDAAGPGARIDLYTFGMPGLPAADETAAAAEVAQRLGRELQVTPADRLWPMSGAEGIRTLQEGSAIGYQELWEDLFERLRRRGTRVLFTGASGDHLFGGSGVLVYPDLLLRGRWGGLARQLAAERRRSGERWPALVWGRLARPLAKAFLPHRWAARRRAAPWLRARWKPLLPDLLPAPEGRWRGLPGRRVRLESLRDPLLPHLLSLQTALAADHGLELRHPLTDHRLQEFAASLPLEQCLRPGLPKYILRGALRDHLPASIVDNPGRTYPMALFERGLRRRERGKVRGLIRGMRAAELGLVDEARLRQAYESYLEGSGGTLFWHTLTLEDWLRRYA